MASRHNVWLTFLSQHHLTPSLFSQLSKFDQDYVAACYTLDLANGNTITSRNISSQCIKNYLQAARISKRVNTLSNSDELTFPPLIQDILTKHAKKESVPNRREPVTVNMLNHWNTLALASPDIDSLESSQFDWFVLGMLAGFRKSEWLQDTYEYKKTKTFQTNIDHTTRAFIAQDFEILALPTSNISHDKKPPHKNLQLQICWRFQKNNQNGQKITFVQNTNNPRFCPVLAAQRILARAKRLNIPTTAPLAAYKKEGMLCYLDHLTIESSIKKCAAHVYDITSPSKLKLYSCHSIRVGACVLLHSTQPDPLYIQFRLRWRSQSFISYLRNTPRLATLHNSILNTTNSDDTHI